jgi:hypothetical protein
MTTSDKSLFEKDVSPFLQLKYALLVTLSIQLIYFLFNHGSEKIMVLRNYYTIALSFTLVFGLFNAVLSLSSKDENKYFAFSLLNYFIFCVVTIISAYFLSGINIDDAGSYRWIYFVFSFGYLLFIGIVRTMRFIVLLAQKEDKRLRGED